MHANLPGTSGFPPPQPPPTMTIADLAQAFQLTPAHMQNKLRGLYAEGFPKKLPGTHRWSRKLVQDWIDYRDSEAAQ